MIIKITNENITINKKFIAINFLDGNKNIVYRLSSRLGSEIIYDEDGALIEVPDDVVFDKIQVAYLDSQFSIIEISNFEIIQEGGNEQNLRN